MRLTKAQSHCTNNNKRQRLSAYASVTARHFDSVSSRAVWFSAVIMAYYQPNHAHISAVLAKAQADKAEQERLNKGSSSAEKKKQLDAKLAAQRAKLKAQRLRMKQQKAKKKALRKTAKPSGPSAACAAVNPPFPTIPSLNSLMHRSFNDRHLYGMALRTSDVHA